MFSFVFKTGFKTLGAKKLFSFASIATISSCVFIFSLFFIFATNIKATINKIESTVGIQVFFDENLSEDEIKRIAEKNFNRDYVKSMKFISSSEAWETFKKEYFQDKYELALAFEDDNPLIHSASFEILLNNIDKQYEYVNFLKSINGVRQVNYSNVLIDTLTSVNLGVTSFSMVLIILLLFIAMILISNTISLASQFRKKENEIMKLIGATNFMIRAPFLIEGLLIGLIGSLIPIIFISLIYKYLMNYLIENTPFIKSIFAPVSIYNILPQIIIISVPFSCIVCILVSLFTISKHLKI